jgi:hypothetical protein
MVSSEDHPIGGIMVPETDNYRQPSAVFAHAEGVVLRVNVEGEDVDVLVTGANRNLFLTALSHSMTEAEVKSFRELLARQGK